MTTLVRLLLLLGLIYSGMEGYASSNWDKVRFSYLNENDGLVNNTILCIHQDAHNFMWFGTRDGLHRYDGYEFKIYKSSNSDSTSITNNFIRDIKEDSKGNLWIATEQGINMFDPRIEKFTHYSIFESNGSLGSQGIFSIIIDDKDVVWYGGTNQTGVGRWDESQQKFINLYKTEYGNLKTDNGNIKLYLSVKGEIYVGTEGGIELFSFEHDSFENLTNEADFSVSNIIVDQSGDVWFGGQSTGVCRLDDETGQITTYHLGGEHDMNSNQIQELIFDNLGNLWVGTEKGVYVSSNYKDEKPQFVELKEAKETSTINQQAIRCIYQDLQGIVWIGTFEHGLNMYRDINVGFELYQHSTNDDGSLSNNNIWCFLEDHQGDVWIGTDNLGVDLFDTETKIFKNYMNVLGTSTDDKLPVLSMYQQEGEDDIWLGTWARGIMKFDPRLKTVDKALHDGREVGMSVWSISEDQNGDVLVGTICDGLYRLDSETLDEIKNYKYDNRNGHNTLSIDGCIWTIYVDSQDVMWLGTHSGIVRYDQESEVFTTYGKNENDPNSLNYHQVISIYEDSKKRFWVGTHGGGISLMDRKTGVFRAYTKEDGLPGNIIFDILEDDHGNLWLGTNNGISKFNTDDISFTNFNESHGLQGKSFKQNSAIKDSKGYMYFAGVNGFNRFHPDSIVMNRFIPKVMLTSFKIYNKEIVVGENSPLKESVLYQGEIILGPQYSMFTLEFASLDFSSPERNQYMFMLEGFDEQWVTVNHNRRFATYTNLAAGSYTFRLKGSNSDGIWSPNETQLVIEVLPEWYKTWWFRSIFFLVFSVLGMLLYFVRIENLKKQKQLLKNEVFEQTKRLLESNDMLKNLHREKDGIINIVAHDLKAPLNNIKSFVQLIGMSGELNDEQKEFLYYINKSINQGNGLIIDLLDVSGINHPDKKFNVESFDICNFIDEWEVNYHKSLQDKNQTLTTVKEQDKMMVFADKELVNRVFDNLLTNAMKFSNEGKSIDLSLMIKEGYIWISFKDYGPGFSPEDKHRAFGMFQKLSAQPTAGETSNGLGLAIVKALVEKMKGEIELNSELGTGAEFIVKLPQSNAI
ncbi:MAG: ATP-binding protein [Reichenbachiella sp.]